MRLDGNQHITIGMFDKFNEGLVELWETSFAQGCDPRFLRWLNPVFLSLHATDQVHLGEGTSRCSQPVRASYWFRGNILGKNRDLHLTVHRASLMRYGTR
jgi:hypothetical protein